MQLLRRAPKTHYVSSGTPPAALRQRHSDSGTLAAALRQRRSGSGAMAAALWQRRCGSSHASDDCTSMLLANMQRCRWSLPWTRQGRDSRVIRDSTRGSRDSKPRLREANYFGIRSAQIGPGRRLESLAGMSPVQQTTKSKTRFARVCVCQ